MVYKKGLFLILVGMLSMMRGMSVSAKEASYQDTVIEAEGLPGAEKLSDANRTTWVKSNSDSVVTISRVDEIGAVYIEFDRVPGEWILKDPISGQAVVCGQNAFLHEYIEVSECFGGVCNKLELHFAEGTSVADIYAFSEGELPDWVQRWQAPCEEADLLLFSSHSDDEQLFFAGMLPLYAGERGLKVQVAYVVQHFEANGVEDHRRPHEQLDGLWTVGIRNYPIISQFPDLYASSKNREEAFAQAVAVYEKAGYHYEDFVGYLTECLRRCKPLVVVSHDVNGEYGHGTHVLCAAALTEAIQSAADTEQYPDSALKYGTWQTQKTYLHLYPENPIKMDYDIPLEHFGGKTAFEVTQDGFTCHKSQHWTWFYKWIYGTEAEPITKASQIKTYSPCLFGLYDSQVGPDIAGGDFLENIVTYEEQARIAAEEAEAKRLEEEARKAEEERKAEEARKAKEKALKEEQERLRLEAERLEAERLEAERLAARKRLFGTVLIAAGVGTALCVGLVLVRYRRRQK